MERWEIAVERRRIGEASVRPLVGSQVAAGEIEVAIGVVGLTANNVTYAAAGDPTPILGEDAGYWDFFGPRDEPGRVPVWGFATVTRSAVEGIAAGDEYWGYWPLASHAVLRPDGNGAGFTEQTPRRASLPAFYNRYLRVAALGDYDEADRDWWPIYRPLFLTGWLIADQLAEAGDHGATTVLVSGASSKTALGFAHAMRGGAERPRLVALASARSRPFVERTDLYDEVVLYEQAAALPTTGRTALVDFAGDGAVTAAVHAHFGEALAIDLKIGLTHWDAPAAAPPEAGSAPTWFFAPARLAKRTADWGGAGLRTRTEAAWRDFMPVARRLTPVERRQGAAAALAAWEALVTGRASPAAGVLIEP